MWPQILKIKKLKSNNFRSKHKNLKFLQDSWEPQIKKQNKTCHRYTKKKRQGSKSILPEKNHKFQNMVKRSNIKRIIDKFVSYWV